MASMVFYFLIGLIMADVNADVSCKSEKILKNIDSILKTTLQLSQVHNNERRVAFSAERSKGITSTKAQVKVIFDKVITNIENVYNSNTGIFTTPSDGLYVFHWTILSGRGKAFDSELVVNGVAKRRNNANAGGGKSWSSGSSMVTLELKQNDQVWIRKWGNSGNTLHGNYWCGFSGFMLA